MQAARRRNKKGRAMGGMVLEIRKENGGKRGDKIRYGKGSYKIIGIYVNGDMERKLVELGEWVEGKEEGMRTIIGRDFNARTEEETKRKSKDKKLNKEGRRLVEWIREKG
ncbi:hypothetical protein P5V15_008394 [Pogonomyrmex californicus]